MDHLRTYITFTLIYDGEEHRIKTYAAEYSNLRDLISDKLFLEGFGECGGMGRCATCLVELSGMDGAANTFQRNEEATLIKAGQQTAKVRLSCQVPIDDDLANVSVTVLESL